MENWLYFLASSERVKNKFLCRFDEIIQLLIALVTNGEPTPSNYYMHDVDTPNGAFRVNKWLMHGETRYSPLVDFVGRCIFEVFFGSDSVDVEYW